MICNKTTCNEWTDRIVERARRSSGNGQADAGPELRAHLSTCANCQERWQAEQELSAQLRIIRSRAEALRSSADSREALMRDFVRMQRVKTMRTWAWALSTAAAVVFAIFLGFNGGHRHPVTQSATQSATAAIASVLNEQSVLYEASMDASALSSDDFIAVPYTPPLAPGEMVRMVHTNLYPEALASMGVQVDPAWAGVLPADIVVGEDGLPRAVRITESGQF
jgi:hypothetical protein